MGWMKENFSITNAALLQVIRRYTREAGCPELERTIGQLCRKAAKQLVSGEKTKVVITDQNLSEFLGAEKYRYGKAEETDQIGAATGSCLDRAGGDTLVIEVSRFTWKREINFDREIR